MAERNRTSDDSPDTPQKARHGLNVPLPAMLVGLGVIASGAPSAHAAQAVDDNYFVATNSTLTGVNILANDTTVPNSTVFVSAGPASNGNAVVDPTGNLNYTPNPGFQGTDSFTYVLTDIESNSIAQVSILVSAPAPAPTLGTAALVGLSGLLAYFGLRRRRKE